MRKGVLREDKLNMAHLIDLIKFYFMVIFLATSEFITLDWKL